VARDDIVGARYAAVQQFVKTERASDLLGQIEAATCMLKLAHLTNNEAEIKEHETKAKVKCLVVMQNIRNDQVSQRRWRTGVSPLSLYTVHRVKRRHRIYGHDTIAILWV